jgi:hypothetical protein
MYLYMTVIKKLKLFFLISCLTLSFISNLNLYASGNAGSSSGGGGGNYGGGNLSGSTGDESGDGTNNGNEAGAATGTCVLGAQYAPYYCIQQGQNCSNGYWKLYSKPCTYQCMNYDGTPRTPNLLGNMLGCSNSNNSSGNSNGSSSSSSSCYQHSQVVYSEVVEIGCH